MEPDRTWLKKKILLYRQLEQERRKGRTRDPLDLFPALIEITVNEVNPRAIHHSNLPYEFCGHEAIIITLDSYTTTGERVTSNIQIRLSPDLNEYFHDDGATKTISVIEKKGDPMYRLVLRDVERYSLVKAKINWLISVRGSSTSSGHLANIDDGSCTTTGGDSPNKLVTDGRTCDTLDSIPIFCEITLDRVSPRVRQVYNLPCTFLGHEAIILLEWKNFCKGKPDISHIQIRLSPELNEYFHDDEARKTISVIEKKGDPMYRLEFRNNVDKYNLMKGKLNLIGVRGSSTSDHLVNTDDGPCATNGGDSNRLVTSVPPRENS